MFQELTIHQDNIILQGHVSTGDHLKGWVIFAHGSGSSRKSPRNNWVASELNKKGYGTFLFDLLTPEEDANPKNRFNISLLAERLLLATKWFMNLDIYRGQPIAYFGASTGAGAALRAAASAPVTWPLMTIISRGGRPDLAGEALSEVKIPVLLIVGSLDHQVIKMNEEAAQKLKSSKLTLVEGATHLFEEHGTLNEVVLLTITWFDLNLPEKEELTWTS